MTDQPNLLFATLSGPQFDDLVYRYREAQPAFLRGLAQPRLRYYLPRSCLIRTPDKRLFMLCVTSLHADGSLDENGDRLAIVGMLELEVSPYDDTVMWLKYITVHPDYQRRGIAKRLLSDMVAHLQGHPHLLQRSSSSDEGKEKIQAYIDRQLADANIAWQQSGR